MSTKQISVNVFSFEQLSKEAKQVVINQHIESEWYDYSDHERTEYNHSLSIFTAAFNRIFGCLLVGDAAKESIVQSINLAAKTQANANPYFADSLNNEYGGEITTIENAISISENCLLTGACTDFYLMDTIVRYLKGEKYQDLTVQSLLAKAKVNGRNELSKQCRFYKSSKHTEQCLIEMNEDYFFADGTVVPTSLLSA